MRETIDPCLLGENPDVLSIGKRCEIQGYGFVWPPFPKTPYFQSPEGDRIPMVSIDQCPYLPDGFNVEGSCFEGNKDTLEPVPCSPALSTDSEGDEQASDIVNDDEGASVELVDGELDLTDGSSDLDNDGSDEDDDEDSNGAERSAAVETAESGGGQPLATKVVQGNLRLPTHR
jgi:hypothetical protein